MPVPGKITNMLGDFTMARVDISKLDPEAVLASYDVTMGREFHKEAPSVDHTQTLAL